MWPVALFLCCAVTAAGQSASSEISGSLAPSTSASPNSGRPSSSGNAPEEVRSNVSDGVAASVNDSSMSTSVASVDSIAGLVAAAVHSESGYRSKLPAGGFQSGLRSTPKASDLNTNRRFGFGAYQVDSSMGLSRSALASTPSTRKGFAASLKSMQPNISAERVGIGAQGTRRRAGNGLETARPRAEGAGLGVENGRPRGTDIDVEGIRASAERAGIGEAGIRLNTELAGTGLADTRADVEASRMGLHRTGSGDHDVATYSLDFPDSTKGNALLSPYDPGEESPFTWNTSVGHEFKDLTRQGFLNPTLHVAAPSRIQTGMISRRAYKTMSVAERKRLRHMPGSLLPKQTPSTGNPLEPKGLGEQGILGERDVLSQPGILGEPNILTNPGLSSSIDQ